ncbi:Xylem serine proteinase 1 [Glycine soja]|nr:Xylem serine proteinase 1 [Glycine soja]
MGELPVARTYAVESHHHNLLEAAIGDKQLARESKIHSYGKSFNGFVARLLPHEAEKLQEEDSVVSVFPNTHRKLHTTRSWDFLGMPLNVKRNSKVESHIIVGVLDTAAVKGASLYGIGKGTARGGVPSARVGMYKVCWLDDCNDMDMLAAFDEAIADGVNIISISIGGPSHDFFTDPIAIGSFHAMGRGILTSCSAGNGGPGLSINTFAPKKKMYPLTSGLLASNLSGEGYGSASGCDYGTLSKEKVQGRIVYCVGGTGTQDLTIKELGGAGAIIGLDEEIDASYTTVIPGTFVEASTVGNTIDLYINSTKNARAVIHKTTTTEVPAPFLASFSSRGPQTITPNILKPDLVAPGVNILAAYSKLVTLTGYHEDNRYDVFNILSGTSMACPHATATAAYVKSFHPDWSPAAIKSALMTTATPIKISDNFTELGSGSGQIDPVKALHPGLVYDMRISSYIGFLCKAGFNNTNIGILIGKPNFNCTSIKPSPGTDGINYPSMHIQLLSASDRISAVFLRTVTNVGSRNSTYKAKVTTPKGLSVKVKPNILKFSRLHQKLSFKVVLKGPPMPEDTFVESASLEWKDSEHTVRSPILVFKPMTVY